MIYYNLESEYEGDFTKHCGLTIAEADGNFYELETMVMDMKKQKFGQTFFYAACVNETGSPQLLPVEIVGDSTYVVNGTVPYTGDITGLGADHALSFLFENPYFIGASRQVSGLPVFVNNINIGDMAGQLVDLVADCIIECALKPHDDEFIIYIPKITNDNRSTNDVNILKKFRNSEFEIVSTITVDRSFNVRIEKQGLVICDYKVIFGEDFHLLPVPTEIDYTEIVPDTEICTPGTVIDVEHQQYEIENHNIRVTTVVDVSDCVGSEKTYFDFPQNFDFGFSIVGSKTPDTEEVAKDEWINIMEQLYPDAEYSAYLVGSESASIPIIHIVDGMFWEHLFDCGGTQYFKTPFTLTVNALHEDRSIAYDAYHTVTLGAFDSKTAYNIGKFYETGFNEMNYSMVFQIRWNDKETEKYTFVFDCTLGKYCQELER